MLKIDTHLLIGNTFCFSEPGGHFLSPGAYWFSSHFAFLSFTLGHSNSFSSQSHFNPVESCRSSGCRTPFWCSTIDIAICPGRNQADATTAAVVDGGSDTGSNIERYVQPLPRIRLGPIYSPTAAAAAAAEDMQPVMTQKNRPVYRRTERRQQN